MTVLLREAIGDSIRRARTGRSRTLRDVSRDARVSLGYLSEVERGRKEPSSELLAAICEALSLPLPDLLDDAAATMRPLAAPQPAVDPALRAAVDPALRSAVEEALVGADEALAGPGAAATRRGEGARGSAAAASGDVDGGTTDAVPVGTASGAAGGDDAAVGSAALALADRRAVEAPGTDAVAGAEVGAETDRGAHPDALRRGLVVGAPADEVVPLTPGTVSLVARLPVTPAGPVDAVVRAA